MELGGHRNNSATKAGISESQSVTVPGFFTVHVVKSRVGAPMMQTKGLLVGTTLSPGQREAFHWEGVKGLRRTSRPDGI
jgi:hypothetical protein